MLGEELAHVGGAGGYDGGGGELGVVQDGEFFVVVAHGLPAVEHARALLLGEGEQLGGIKVLHIEGRVAAHDDGVKLG